MRIRSLIGVLLMVALTAGCSGKRGGESGKDYRQRLAEIRLKRKAENDVMMLQRAVREFQTRHARLPDSLEELVRRRLIEQLPVAPEGLVYDYDNTLGNVVVRRASAPTNVASQPAATDQRSEP